MCLVPNAQVALSTLFSIVEAIQKREIRCTYFQRQQTRYFLPRCGSIPESCRPAAAIHVAEALRSWADRFDLPPGEVNVLMSMMGSLGKIVTADGLDLVPVEERTKRLLRAFFGVSHQKPFEDTQDNPFPATVAYHQEIHQGIQRIHDDQLHPDPDLQEPIHLPYPQQVQDVPGMLDDQESVSMVHPPMGDVWNSPWNGPTVMYNEDIATLQYLGGPLVRPHPYFQMTSPQVRPSQAHGFIPSFVPTSALINEQYLDRQCASRFSGRHNPYR